MIKRILLGVIVFAITIMGFCFVFWSVDFSSWRSADRGFALFIGLIFSVCVAANPLIGDD